MQFVEEKMLDKLIGKWYNGFQLIVWLHLERCLSGLKSRSWKPVIPQGTVGSNPTFSASCFYLNNLVLRRITQVVKGLPC